MSRRRRASALAYLAGALLVLGGANGGADLWLFLAALAARLLPALAPELALVALVLALFAAGGGLTVALGGRLVAKGHPRSGLFLIDVGAGVGFLALGLALVEAWLAGVSPFAALAGYAGTLTGAGVLLALAAQAYAR